MIPFCRTIGRIEVAGRNKKQVFAIGTEHRVIRAVPLVGYWIFFLPKHENPLPCDMYMKTMTGKCYLNGFTKNKIM